MNSRIPEGGPGPTDLRASSNQAPLLAGHNVVTSDHALVEAVTRHASADVVDDLAEIGALAGTEEARSQGMLANQNPPRLTPYDTSVGSAKPPRTRVKSRSGGNFSLSRWHCSNRSMSRRSPASS